MKLGGIQGRRRRPNRNKNKIGNSIWYNKIRVKSPKYCLIEYKYMCLIRSTLTLNLTFFFYNWVRPTIECVSLQHSSQIWHIRSRDTYLSTKPMGPVGRSAQQYGPYSLRMYLLELSKLLVCLSAIKSQFST